MQSWDDPFSTFAKFLKNYNFLPPDTQFFQKCCVRTKRIMPRHIIQMCYFGNIKLLKNKHPNFKVYVMAVYNLVLRSRVSSQEI